MNLQSMSNFVRAQADTDVTDAPDATLEVYARAAYNHIQSLVWPWPQNRTYGTFSTVSGQANYPFAGLVGAPTMELVLSVEGDGEVLQYVSPSQFRQLRVEQSSFSTPRFYTIDYDEVRLWPTPVATGVTYTVEGYRAFANWPQGSNEPDLPRGFDEAICWFMLAKYYLGQEDVELSVRYMANFESVVETQIAASLRGSGLTAGPLVFGGNVGHTMSYADWVRRNTES